MEVSGVTTDGRGRLFVCDSFNGNRCIKVFSVSDGKYLACLLVSTYVVCKRLSVMHEPAGVVEILVQIQGEYPYSEIQNTPPPMKIVRESKSESFRLPLPK